MLVTLKFLGTGTLKVHICVVWVIWNVLQRFQLQNRYLGSIISIHDGIYYKCERREHHVNSTNT